MTGPIEALAAITATIERHGLTDDDVRKVIVEQWLMDGRAQARVTLTWEAFVRIVPVGEMVAMTPDIWHGCNHRNFVWQDGGVWFCTTRHNVRGERA